MANLLVGFHISVICLLRLQTNHVNLCMAHMMRFKAVWELEETKEMQAVLERDPPRSTHGIQVGSSPANGHKDIDTPSSSKPKLIQNPAKTSQKISPCSHASLFGSFSWSSTIKYHFLRGSQLSLGASGPN